MASRDRPYIGAIKPYTWKPRKGTDQVPGLLIGGASGVAAHLTKAEAYDLANRLVDAADQLPDNPATPAE